MVDEEKCTKPKHKIIADAYAKRHQSVISVSLQNSHTDPVNVNYSVNFPANSVVSNTWTQCMPYLLNRRDAFTVDPSTACESEISVSVRQYDISVGSRRNSADSQVSVKMSETEIKVKKVKSRSQRNKFKKASVKNRRIERRKAVTAYDIMNVQNKSPPLNSDDENESYDWQEHRQDHSSNILDGIGYTDASTVIPSNASLQSFFKMLNGRNPGNIQEHQSLRQCAIAMDNIVDEDESSLSSSIEQDIGNMMHSSYSAHSMGGNAKTHSRTSKGSCDVGIQANAKDIAAHARSYNEEMARNILTDKKRNGHIEDDEEFTEMHQLIQDKHNTIAAEQLERLLLPDLTIYW